MDTPLQNTSKPSGAVSRCTTCQIYLAESSLRNHNNSEIHLHIIESLNNNLIRYNDGWQCLTCDKPIPCSEFNRSLKKHFESDGHKNKTLRNRTIVSQSISHCIEHKRNQNNNETPILALVKELVEVKNKIEHVEKVIEDVIMGNFMSKVHMMPLIELTGLDLLASIVAPDSQYVEQNNILPTKKQRRY